ncbi:MAG: response regulator [Sphingobium sp.]
MAQPAILVVEDEPILRLNAIDILESEGFEALEAENADAAIAILTARPDIQLLFTDIEMPGSMDGLQLAAFVRDRWPSIHIILTSGRGPIDLSGVPTGCLFYRKPQVWPTVIDSMRRLTADSGGGAGPLPVMPI